MGGGWEGWLPRHLIRVMVRRAPHVRRQGRARGVRLHVSRKRRMCWQGRVAVRIVVRVAGRERLTQPNPVAEEACSRAPAGKAGTLPLGSELLQLHHVVLIRICGRWTPSSPRRSARGLPGEASVRGGSSISTSWSSPCTQVGPRCLRQLLLVEVLLLPVNHPCRVHTSPETQPVSFIHLATVGLIQS